MKPAAFSYHRVVSLADALARLSEEGEDAKVLAGGQSLVPMMNFRLVRPAALIDITRIAELRGMRRSDGVLRIGSLTTHAEIEFAGAALEDGYEILRRAAGWVGHLPIRSRGTFGGSLAHADPAAEWCMIAVALDASIEITGPQGVRQVPAARFLQGFFSTDLASDEVLTSVTFPAPCPRASIQEFARRHGDFAIVAAVVALPPDGPARIVIGGVDEVPVRAQGAERILEEGALAPECFADAGQAAAEEIEPTSDLHGSADFRRQLTDVLVRRALDAAVEYGG